MRRALVSVYDKTGLIGLAGALHAAGVEIVSTGSTAATIAATGVPVTRVEDLTGFPECLDGRVKTLHPRVHAGVLADTRLPEHLRQLDELGIAPFELVVVNLYPFTATVASGASPDECVEQIDIGGPSMVRAAAKNHPSVAVVVDPARYDEVVEAVNAGGFTLEARRLLAADAFAHTAAYDTAVASWFAGSYAPDDESGFPKFAGSTYERGEVLRYGENPHQQAALYLTPDGAAGRGLAGGEQLHGKAMSYNNYVDADAAWRAAHDHDAPPSPSSSTPTPAGSRSARTSPTRTPRRTPATRSRRSAASSRPTARSRRPPRSRSRRCSPRSSSLRTSSPRPSRSSAARRTSGCSRSRASTATGTEQRAVTGGLLVQQVDRIDAPGDDPSTWTLAAGQAADEATLTDLVFAWRAVRAVKSNAILLANDGASVGVGMGQVNRVDSCALAVARANTGDVERARGRGGGVGRVLPVRRRRPGAHRRRRARDRAARRLGARRGGRRGGAGGRRDPLPDGHAALRALS